MSVDEKEQIEAIKKWWKDNGSSVITGVLLGLSVLLGGKAWFAYQENRQLSASNVYAQLLEALQREDEQQVRAHANELISNYSATGYSPMAAMILAGLAVKESEPEVAEAQLRWALEHVELPEMAHTVRLRLVRVLIDAGKPEQANQLLDEASQAGAYQYLYDELRGDLSLAGGDAAAAAAAYKAAIDAMPADAPNAAFLSAKYEDVAGADGAVK